MRSSARRRPTAPCTTGTPTPGTRCPRRLRWRISTSSRRRARSPPSSPRWRSWSGAWGWLPEALAGLREQELLRVLTYCASAPDPEVMVDGAPHLLLASNNCLGLANDPRVVAGARAALESYGAGAGASRLVTGSL